MPKLQIVDNRAFDNCTSLTAVAMPQTVAMPGQFMARLNYASVFFRTNINSKAKLDELNDKYILGCNLSNKVLIAYWADARARRRAGEAPREGSPVLELFGKIPRAGLAEVLEQNRSLTLDDIKNLRSKYDKYLELLTECIQKNMDAGGAAGGDAAAGGAGGAAGGAGGENKYYKKYIKYKNKYLLLRSKSN